MLTLKMTGKAADTVLRTQSIKSVLSACKYLVGIGLMTYIKNYLVIRRIEHFM